MQETLLDPRLCTGISAFCLTSSHMSWQMHIKTMHYLSTFCNHVSFTLQVGRFIAQLYTRSAGLASVVNTMNVVNIKDLLERMRSSSKLRTLWLM